MMHNFYISVFVFPVFAVCIFDCVCVCVVEMITCYHPMTQLEEVAIGKGGSGFQCL